MVFDLNPLARQLYFDGYTLEIMDENQSTTEKYIHSLAHSITIMLYRINIIIHIVGCRNSSHFSQLGYIWLHSSHGFKIIFSGKSERVKNRENEIDFPFAFRRSYYKHTLLLTHTHNTLAH